MKILYLAHRIPYPPNKGDKIRSFNEIKYLSKNHTIDLVCLADDPKDLKSKDRLKKYCRRIHVQRMNKTVAKLKGIFSLLSGKPISVGYFHRPEVQKVVNQWLTKNSYNAVVCFSSPMAEYIFQANAAKPTRLIMDFVDVDSDKWQQYAQTAPLPLNMIYQLESKRLRRYDIKINRSFSQSVFVSSAEAALFKLLLPNARHVTAIPNGVDHNYFSPDLVAIQKKDSPKPVLLFTGAMDYHANIDGVSWFCSQILPDIRKRHPQTTFYIVGDNPHPSVKALEKIDGVHVTGFVEDIRPYYQFADICIAPLRLARGVQNKVLEAMAMATPVVTTTAAVRGISTLNGGTVVVADTPEAFSAAINQLLDDSSRRKYLARAGRQFVRQHYDWQNNMQSLERLIINPSGTRNPCGQYPHQ